MIFASFADLEDGKSSDRTSWKSADSDDGKINQLENDPSTTEIQCLWIKVSMKNGETELICCHLS